YYRSLEFDGLKAISRAEARSYFVSGDTLFRLRSDRIFTPDRLQDSMVALSEVLARQGYRDAVVTTNWVQMNEKSGAVTVRLKVREGLPTYVRSVAVTVVGSDEDDHTSTNRETLHPDKPYSRLWQEDLARHLRAKEYARGYPDAAVEFSALQYETNATRIQVDMAARVGTGPRVRVGRVIYSGNRHTRSSVINSHVTFHPGDWLNPLAAEESRQRLAGLGVFDSVRLHYEDTNAAARNVIYDFKETKPISLSLLAGYGSYEMLRGGLEWEDRNVLGLAHDIRIRGVQSFKSTSGEAQYTVPEVLGENLNAFVKGSGLRREEVSFLRKEYGGSVGVQKYLAPVKTDLGIRYEYEFLNTSELNTTNAGSLGATNARSAAIVIDLSRDRRETPLLPRRGLKLFSKIELAADALGGNVNYQR
ncbi:MAG TPA: POTRA domain-containing protein, partial [Candidatus Binatia bacterium]|nr:POTRA domain-containing protein [Candidatus Binatia bacterium]